MNLYTVDLSGTKDIIDTFRSVIWTVQFFGMNDFELVVPATEKNLSVLTPGTLLVREADITEAGFKNVMMVENITIDFDTEKGWTMTCTGGGLKKILNQRIVWKQTNLSGTVEDGIRQVITENVISPSDSARKIANFVLDTKKGYTETFDLQLLGESIGTWLSECGQTYGYGWDVAIRNGKYVFLLTKGVDRTYDQTAVVPVVFSPEYDNLISSSYIYESNEYSNAALIGGEGEGESQRTATIGTATGLNRFETYIDGSGVSSNGEIITVQTYMQMLRDYGKEQLAKTSFTEKVEGKIVQNDMYTIGVDYSLGDIVQIKNSFIDATSRIIEIIYSEDEDGSQLIPTFGSWEGE